MATTTTVLGHYRLRRRVGGSGPAGRLGPARLGRAAGQSPGRRPGGRRRRRWRRRLGGGVAGRYGGRRPLRRARRWRRWGWRPPWCPWGRPGGAEEGEGGDALVAGADPSPGGWDAALRGRGSPGR